MTSAGPGINLGIFELYRKAINAVDGALSYLVGLVLLQLYFSGSKDMFRCANTKICPHVQNMSIFLTFYSLLI